MAKFRFEWSNKAFREIRTLPSVKRELEQRASQIARSAGDGYEVDSGVTGGRGRARSAVYPVTAEAAADNAKTNALLKALGRNT